MASRYGLEIRTAAAADAPGLAGLLGLADPRALAEQLAALHQASGTALVATDWGPPSGLVVLHWYRGLGPPQPTAQITTLVVRPEDRRRGIGRLLLKAAAQAARSAGCGLIELRAPAPAASLQAFAGATGFTPAAACWVRPLRKAG